ncbi:glutamate receptor ionotropic, delta-2-like [Procambarus clarkii]|uniref:glutamate receptor ionotropic, delta-2-like n=1 Tax=Procambarus clarkii TaxID=6728 RepID=UPI0037438A3B
MKRIMEVKVYVWVINSVTSLLAASSDSDLLLLPRDLPRQQLPPIQLLTNHLKKDPDVDEEHSDHVMERLRNSLQLPKPELSRGDASIHLTDMKTEAKTGVTLTPEDQSETGVKLGAFLIDVLYTTGHTDIHFVTRGQVVKGLDKVVSMVQGRYIQTEIYTNMVQFLTDLGPTEGYLSTDQFIVYGTSVDILYLIYERRPFMEVINIGLTTWYYVVLDHQAETQTIADALEEASTCVLLRPSRHRVENWAAYTLVSPGDGSRHFRYVGTWTERRGLELTRDIFPKHATNFRGRTLTVGVINKPRVLQLKEIPSTMQGYSYEILVIMQEHHNFTLNPRRFIDWGSTQDNGSWDGVIGALRRKEIDFSPMDFTPTKESREVIDFSEWVSENPVVITSAAPQPKAMPFILLEVFHPQVYLVLAGLVIFSSLVMYTLNWANTTLLPGVHPSRGGVHLDVLNTNKSLVAQCTRKLPTEDSVRVYIMMILFMSFILDSTYQGSITAFVTMPRFTAAIDNHEELSDNTSVTPVTECHSATQTMIMESERKSFQSLATRLEVFEAAFIDSEDFFDGVAVGKWALVDTASSSYGRALDFENEGARCRFHKSRNSIIGGLDAWPFPRNSPVHKPISTTMKWLRYYGVLEHIKVGYYRSRCYSTQRLKSREAPKKMDLVMMQSSFYVLGLGWSLGIIVFLTELLVPAWSRHCAGEVWGGETRD